MFRAKAMDLCLFLDPVTMSGSCLYRLSPLYDVFYSLHIDFVYVRIYMIIYVYNYIIIIYIYNVIFT